MKRIITLMLLMLFLISGCSSAEVEVIDPQNSSVVTVDPQSDVPDTQESPTPTPETDVSAPQTQAPSSAPAEDESTSPKEEIESTPSVDEVTDLSEEEETVTITCMTFNVLAYDPDESVPRAPERAPAALAFIKEQNCDIIGLQEAVDVRGFNWVPAKEIFDFDTYFREGLQDEYAAFGINETDTAGEGLMIFYRKSRFEVKDCGGAEYTTNTNSFYQWMRLYDKKAKREIYITNTHLSPNKNGDFAWGNSMRMPQSMQLAAFWNKTVKDMPLLATGDYNCKVDVDEQAAPHHNLQKSDRFYPSLYEALSSDGKSGYDLIYFNRDQMMANTHDQINRNYTVKGQSVQMSDHCPIISEFEYI